ncbi:MAG: D-alanine--D-alanine ligase family protein [bacterium]|nr:D-alanine--D-alanine ligase family protein [bacterium]
MKTIAVIFGGRSVEHDVSIITAHIPIIETLIASQKFDVWPVYIAKDGSWYSGKKMNELAFFKQPDFEEQLAREKKIQLSFDKGLSLVWPGLMSKSVHIDVVFPSMHGTFGEDGSLMGLLRMAGVPFVGCDMTASAVAMDKVLTKQVLAQEGIPVVPSAWFTKREWLDESAQVRGRISKLKLPLFVKPAHLGSSIGITKVKKQSELQNALEVAIHYDDKILVEEGVENLIEVTLPIMGDDIPRAALVERPLNRAELFDFNGKYMSGGKKGGGANSAYSVIPADIGEKLTRHVIEMGKKVYRILGCSGIARVDFLINSITKKVYVIEVNTMPGSLYHHNWKKDGVSNMELVLGLIKMAEDRFNAQKSTNYTFRSDILNKVGGPSTGADHGPVGPSTGPATTGGPKALL